MQVRANPVILIPVALLKPADSPRQRGEDVQHIENLSVIESELPPLVVHQPTMRVIDGMHRLRAAERNGEKYVRAQYFDGAEHDCFPLAVHLNATHGLPLTLADRVAAAARIVASRPDWSDRAVAAVVGVSPKTVAAQRSTEEIPRSNVRLGKDGRLRPCDTSDRRQAAAAFLAECPSASLRQIARASGLSIGTARDVRIRVQNGQDPVLTGRVAQGPENVRPVLSAPVVGLGRTTGTSATSEPIDHLVDCLRRDPTLRMTESGRVLLRILEANRALTVSSEKLVSAVPEHCIQALGQAARHFAQIWAEIENGLTSGMAVPPRGSVRRSSTAQSG